MYSVNAIHPTLPSLSIERMAAAMILHDKPFGQGPKMNGRVVFRFLSGSRHYWFASCLGKNWKHPSGDGNKVFETTAAAIQWLQEGR